MNLSVIFHTATECEVVLGPKDLKLTGSIVPLAFPILHCIAPV